MQFSRTIVCVNVLGTKKVKEQISVPETEEEVGDLGPAEVESEDTRQLKVAKTLADAYWEVFH